MRGREVMCVGLGVGGCLCVWPSLLLVGRKLLSLVSVSSFIFRLKESAPPRFVGPRTDDGDEGIECLGIRT